MKKSPGRVKFWYFGNLPQFIGKVPGGQRIVNIRYCKTSPEEKQPSQKKKSFWGKKVVLGQLRMRQADIHASRLLLLSENLTAQFQYNTAFEFTV